MATKIRYKVWDNQPGGRIVYEYTTNGKTYVEVEFENSPGQTYTFIKDD